MICLSKPQIKRNHHYIPRFHLAGFTRDGKIDSPFWVFDSNTGNQWESNPNRTAIQKDLYSLDLPNTQSDALEDVFADLENTAAPIIKNICETLVMPNDGEQFVCLMNYIALLSERTPVRREVYSKGMDSLLKMTLEESLSDPDNFEMIKQKMIKDGKGFNESMSRETLYDFLERGKYSIKYDNNTHVKNLLISIDAIIPTMLERKWSVVFSPSTLGDYICSDSPVSLHWTDAKKARGFWSSPGHNLIETEISIPLSSRVMLLGRFDDKQPASGVLPSRKSLAIINSYTGMHSKGYIFSREKDFHWYAENDKIANIDDFKKLIELNSKY